MFQQKFSQLIFEIISLSIIKGLIILMNFIIDWIITTGANVYHEDHFAWGLPIKQGSFNVDDTKLYENVKIQNDEYLIEIRTWAKINQFNFDHGLGEISFELIGEDSFVTTIIPIDFLSEPYQVFLDGEKILFHDSINNGTHVWLNIRPQNSGEVSITGTVSPDIEISAEDDFLVEYVIVGIIIVGIVIIGVFFFKRKK